MWEGPIPKWLVSLLEEIRAQTHPEGRHVRFRERTAMPKRRRQASEEPAQPAPWSWISSLWNDEKMYVNCLNPCSVVLCYGSWETTTPFRSDGHFWACQRVPGSFLDHLFSGFAHSQCIPHCFNLSPFLLLCPWVEKKNSGHLHHPHPALSNT